MQKFIINVDNIHGGEYCSTGKNKTRRFTLDWDCSDDAKHELLDALTNCKVVTNVKEGIVYNTHQSV